jgi:hypothetical protein
MKEALNELRTILVICTLERCDSCVSGTRGVVDLPEDLPYYIRTKQTNQMIEDDSTFRDSRFSW